MDVGQFYQNKLGLVVFAVELEAYDRNDLCLNCIYVKNESFLEFTHFPVGKLRIPEPAWTRRDLYEKVRFFEEFVAADMEGRIVSAYAHHAMFDRKTRQLALAVLQLYKIHHELDQESYRASERGEKYDWDELIKTPQA